MAKASRSVRMIHMAVEPTLLEQVDDYTWQDRMPSRTAAWKWLVWAAMQAGLHPTPDQLAELRDGKGPWNG